jgi:uncharacterized membrane protein
MAFNVKTFLIIGAVMLLLDALWLTVRADYHRALFASVQGSPLEMRLLPAIGVYIILPVIVYFAAVTGAQSLGDAAKRGAYTGFLIYAFYDLTNYATFKRWTLQMTVTDTLWGTALCALGAASGYYFS